MKKSISIIIPIFAALSFANGQIVQPAAAPSAGGKIGTSPNGLYKHIGIAGQAGSTGHTTFANGTSGNFGLLNVSKIKQTPETLDFISALNVGGDAVDQMNAIALDEDNNVYVTGSFRGNNVDFNPYGDPSLLSSNSGSNDIFVAKYNSCNELVWAYAIGGNSDNDHGLAIELDGLGNFYVSGRFGGTADFDLDTGTDNKTAQGTYEGFLVKYDKDARLQWFSGMGMGNTITSHWNNLTIDSGGNIYAVGEHIPGQTTSGALAKYTADGNVVWRVDLTRSSFKGSCLDRDGNVIITGWVEGNGLNLDPLNANTSFNGLGDQDVVLAKYNGSNGHLIWAHLLGGADYEVGTQVDIDAGNNIYVTGSFNGQADFDPGSGVVNLTSSGNFDVFLAKYDNDGNYSWGKQIGGSKPDRGAALVTGERSVYIGGYFASLNADFDPGPEELILNPNGGLGDVFIAQFQLDGILMGAFSIDVSVNTGSSNIGNGNENEAMDLDYKDGTLGVAGFFTEQNVDFDPSENNDFSLSVPLQSTEEDGFFALYGSQGVQNVVDETAETSICSGDSILIGGIYRKTAGMYADTLPGPGLCDTIRNFNLNVLEPISTVLEASIAEGQSYVFGSQTLTEAGTYTETFQSIIGCDSIVSLTLEVVEAFDLDFLRALNVGGAATDVAVGIVLDEESNVYVTGGFRGLDVDFNPYGTPFLLSSEGDLDIFVAKYNNCNELVWAFSIGGSSDQDLGQSIDLDANGNVYVGGYFGSAGADFDPGPATAGLSPQGRTDGFLAKYDTDGNLQWAFNIGGSIADKRDFLTGVTAAPTGDVYITGFMFGTMDLDPGPGVATISADNNFANGVLAKYTTDGNFEWGFKVGNNSTNRFHTSVLDSEGNIIITGFGQNGGLDFDPLGPTSTSLNAIDGSDVILAKYNGDNGHLIWAHLFGGPDTDIGSQLAVDADDNIYLGGYFAGQSDFDPGSGDNTQSSAGSTDAFLAKYDQDGNHLWAHRIGGSGEDNGASIVVGGEYVYIGGPFSSTNVDFDPGPGVFTLSPNGGFDAFVAQFQLDGTFADAFNIGGASSNHNLVDLDYRNGTLGLAGYFGGQNVDFDPSENSTFSLSNPLGSDGEDGYFALYGIENRNYINTMAEAFICSGDSIQIGGVFRKTAGVYQDTILAAGIGCDTISTIQLTVNEGVQEMLSQTICAGQSYTFGNQSLTESGVYTELFSNQSGCDSLVTLTLTVDEAIQENLTQSICAGESVMVGSSVYMTSGLYQDTLSSVGGCDSIVTLDLTVNEVLREDLMRSICAGDSVLVGSSVYTTSGLYQDTLSSVGGCDSIVSLDLTVNEVLREELTRSICAGDSVMVGSSVYTVSGLYQDILSSVGGCDSIVILDLTVNEVLREELTRSICAGDSVMVGSSVYTVSGLYQDTLSSVGGCDSIVTLDLTVNEVLREDLTRSICAGDSVMIGSSVYTASGLYQDTLSSVGGCDSIVTLDLTVNEVLQEELTRSICAGDSVLVGASAYTVSGLYQDTLSSVGGCDSIVTLDLTVNEVLLEELTRSICAGDSVMIGSSVYTASGLYQDTLSSVGGCDSIVTLDLTVNEVLREELTRSICAGESVMVGASVYMTSGLYQDTLSSVGGCDSIVSLDLTVNEVLQGTLSQTICTGETYQFGNQILNEAGTYRDTLNSSGGCDSIAVLNLVVISPGDAMLGADRTVCEEDVALSANLPAGTSGVWTSNSPALIENPSNPNTNILELAEGDNRFTWTLSSPECPNYSSSDEIVISLRNQTVRAEADTYVLLDGSIELLGDVLLNDDLGAVQNWAVELQQAPQTGVLNLNVDGSFVFDLSGAEVEEVRFTYVLINLDCPEQFADAEVIIRVEGGSPPSSFEDYNTITPNGDGANDQFVIPELENSLKDYPNNEIIIFNRWGDIVFQAKPYQNDWGGTNQKGKLLPQGTYYYVLKLDFGEGEVKSGYVLVLR